jgi:tRNA-splicing ligase RtcB (3'-phosphate/5'-hydroxy nucleic acid ligase)
MNIVRTDNSIQFGNHDDATIQQLERCIDASGEAARGALCADGHKGYSMPIGGVVASDEVVMPAGVGYDIGCGNMAAKTNILAKDIDCARVMDEVWKRISFGMGRNNDEDVDHPVFDEIAHSPVRQQRLLIQSSRNQLGTVGSGNHYVDLFEDRADGKLWIGVHFGSRGLGHKTASGFLAMAQGKTWDDHADDSMDAAPSVIPITSPLAQDYLAAMEIAGKYAYAGREWVVNRVLQILGGQITYSVHNHHNYAWWETHNGRKMLVTRKGATPAFPGQQGFIGASMGEDAVIVEGIDSPTSVEALYSTVHGAGRAMSRTQAAGKMRRISRWKCQHRDCDYTAAKGGYHKDPNGPTPTCPTCGHKLRLTQMQEPIPGKPGLVNWPEWQQKLKSQGIELRGGGADEAPQAYKRLTDVLAHHDGTIKILHTLRPIGVAMAGHEVFDLYRD